MRTIQLLALLTGFALLAWTGNGLSAQDKKDDKKEPDKKEPDKKPPEKKEPALEPDQVKGWLADLKDKDKNKRKTAAQALAKAGPRAVDAMKELPDELMKLQQDEKDKQLADLASYVLAFVTADPKAKAPEMLQLLKIIQDSKQPAGARSLAAQQLASMGSKADESFSDLVNLLKNGKDANTRGLAAYVLPYIKPNSDASTEPLANALSDANPQVALAAATSLVLLGEEASGATDAAIKLLENKDAYRRTLACYVLSGIKPDPKKAFQPLLKHASDPNENAKVSQSAKDAIKRVDPEGAKKAGID